MAIFTDYTNILPDPVNKIGTAGQADPAGSAGPGFASVSLNSRANNLRDRTNSGRLLSRSAAYHMWNIRIEYNPMTKEEFEPVYSFLMNRQATLKPFLVELPQYIQSIGNPIVDFQTPAGATRLVVNSVPCKPGDIFNIDDPNDAKHVKTYKITRVETETDYQSIAGSPGAGNIRIHFTPGLQKTTYQNATVLLDNPQIRVISANDTLEYSLNSDGLYSFSLSLEEAL